jgi:DNA-binding NarL/FixJ family response regulator
MQRAGRRGQPRRLSNAETAEALVVTDSTAKTRITHILQELGLHDRAQLVVLAYKAGLV